MIALHPGPYKTATTTLQHAFSESAERLRSFGVSYDPLISPKMGPLPEGDDARKAHHQLAFPFLGSPRAVVTCDDVREWFAGVASRPGVTLVSSEALWSMNPEDLLDLLALARTPVRVVAVLRCAVDSAFSAWHTAVAEGYPGDYRSYVADCVLGNAHKNLDYAYHLGPLMGRCDVKVVDYAAPGGALVPQVIAALGLPAEAFAREAPLLRQHVRPSPWVTALTLEVQRHAAFTGVGPNGRSLISNALRHAAGFVSPTVGLSERAAGYASLPPDLQRALEALCASNRRAVAGVAAGSLAECCGGAALTRAAA